MCLFRQFIHRLISHCSRSTSCQDHLCLFFQFYQFIIQCIIFQIAHDFPVLSIICAGCFFQYSRQFFHPPDRLLSFFCVHMPPLLSLCFSFRSFTDNELESDNRASSSFRSSPSMFLQVPSFKLPSRIFMILTLCRVITRYPSVSHIRRICRFNPCVKMIRKLFSPVFSTLQGRVTVSRIATPRLIFLQNSSVTGLFTDTRYSFS